jgi:predicted RNA binding protein YcfA (HicA-like mRNA interferase family)
VDDGLAGITTTRMCRALEALGFVAVHGRLRHAVYRHGDGRRVTVPVFLRRIVPRATLRAILADAAIAEGDFLRALP